MIDGSYMFLPYTSSAVFCPRTSRVLPLGDLMVCRSIPPIVFVDHASIIGSYQEALVFGRKTATKKKLSTMQSPLS